MFWRLECDRLLGAKACYGTMEGPCLRFREFGLVVWPLKSDGRLAVADCNVAQSTAYPVLMILFQLLIGFIVRDIVLSAECFGGPSLRSAKQTRLRQATGSALQIWEAVVNKQIRIVQIQDDSLGYRSGCQLRIAVRRKRKMT